MPKGEGTDVRRLFGEDYRSAEPIQKMLRRSTGYRGKGAYWGKALGGWAGGRLSALTGFDQFKNWGEKAGDWASDKAQDFAMGKIKKFTGSGLYGGQGGYMNNNSLIAGGAQSMDILGNNDETETITIRNSESMFEIFAPTIASGSSAFTSQKVAINPGLYDFSRKLSAIAKNYVQYEVKQLVFEIRPLVSDSNVNNGISGSIMAAVNYDPIPEVPDNKDDFMDISGAVSGRIVDNLNVGVECDRSKTKDTEYFTRTGPVPLGRDVDEFDHCALYIATNNIPSAFSNIAIAELYVYYTIELRMWRPNRDIQKELVVCSGDKTISYVANSEVNIGDADVISNKVGFAQLNNIGIKYGTVATNLLGPRWTMTFPATFSGLVEVVLSVEGTSLTLVGTPNQTYTVSGNVEKIVDLFAAGSATSDSPADLNSVNNTSKIIVRHRLRIRSATGATDNMFVMFWPAATGVVSQWAIETTEYSPQLFQKGLINPIPRFVDNKGLEVSVI